MAAPEEEITLYLRRPEIGADRQSQDRLYRLVEGQLKTLARSLLKNTNGDHTLQPTVLVDEAFVRLVNGPDRDWEGRSHFFRIAYGTMRRILIDHSRRRRPGKISDNEVAAIADARASSPSRALEEQEALRVLADAIGELEQKEPAAAETFLFSFFHRLQAENAQELLALLENYDGEKLPIRELARQRGLTISSAWRQLGKALDFLQEKLHTKGMG